MTDTHTPGPWLTDKRIGESRGESVAIVAKSGQYIGCTDPVLEGTFDAPLNTANAALIVHRVNTYPDLLDALRVAVAAFEYQVEVCHAREAAFNDTSIHARPMDFAEVTANMYAATAEPLTAARAAIKKAEKG